MAAVNVANLKAVLHVLVHGHAADEVTTTTLHRLVDALDSDEDEKVDRFAGQNDDEVLNAALSGDAEAAAEYKRRRAQAQGSTVTPTGGAVTVATEA